MTTHLHQILESLGRPRIAVVGDVMLDAYVWGQVRRISPEAPIPVLHAGAEDSRPGGSANVALNLAALGARTECFGVVGGDDAGRTLARALRGRGIGGGGLVLVPGRPTPVKTRIVAHRQQIVRVDREDPSPLSDAAAARLGAAVRRRLPALDAVVFSDYAKGTLTPALVAGVVAAARRRDVLVLAGPKGRDHRKYRGVHGLTLNRAELGVLTHEDAARDGGLDRGARRLLRELGLRCLVVTLGERGMALYVRDRAGRLDVPARAREVFDVTGAGDTVLATFALALAGGAGAADAARLANAAAGVVVGKIGAEVVTRPEIADALAEPHHAHGRKVLDPGALRRALARERAAGRSIVFTNGCYDLLHPGHVQTLAFAKAQGDVLVVGINSDRSVRRLKGPGRPIRPQAARASVLAALEATDYVTVFDAPAPLALIRAVRPDVLVKGGDRGETVKAVRDFMKSTGGRIALAPVVAGESTTGIASRIREKQVDDVRSVL